MKNLRLYIIFTILIISCATPRAPLPTMTVSPGKTIQSAVYVALNGNDSNPGTLAEPLKTVTKAVSLAQPGTVIYLRGGEYAENVVVNKSGAEGNPITIRSYPSEVVTISGGTGHVFRDSGGQGYWVIEGLRLVTTGGSSVAVMMTSTNWNGSITHHWTVQNNVLEGGGVLIRGNNHIVRNNLIDGQRLAKSGDDWRSGIREFSSASHHNLYEGNTIKGFYRSGIWSMSYTHDSRFIDNTITDIYGKDTAGQCLNLDGAGSVEYRHVVAGNDVSKCGSEAIQFENVFDSLMENNFVHDTYRGITVTNYTATVGCALQEGYGDTNGDGACRDEVSNTIVRQNLVVNASGGAFTNYGADGYVYLMNSVRGGWAVMRFTKPDVQTRTDVIGNITGGTLPAQLRIARDNLTPSLAYVDASSYLPAPSARDVVVLPSYTNSVTGNWTLDFAGLPRLVGGGYDIGAYEVQTGIIPSPTPTPTGTPVPLVGIYYVSPSGSDTNPGTESLPFKTITKAIDAAKTGDTIYVRAGTYPAFTVSKSGLKILAYPNERPLISGGLGVWIKANDVLFSGFEVANMTGDYIAGIVSRGNNNTIENNTVHDIFGLLSAGIAANWNSGGRIADNVVYSTSFFGIGVYKSTGITVSGNVAYGNVIAAGDADGIHCSQSSGNTFTNNTMYGNSDDGLDTWDCPSNAVSNNIAYRNGGTGDGNGFKLGFGGLNTVTGNLAYENYTCGFTSNGGGNYYENNISRNNGDCGFEDDWRASGNTQPSQFINNQAWGNRANFRTGQYTVVFQGNAVPTLTPTITRTPTSTATPTVIPTTTANCLPAHGVWVCDKKP